MYKILKIKFRYINVSPDLVTSEIFSTVKAVKLHLMYNKLKMHDQYAIKLLSKYAGGA